MSSKPRIHFVCLVSVDYDLDMLPYFLPHYSGLEMDNYCIFLHEGKNTDSNLWAEKSARELGWKARFVPREASYGNGELKRQLLNKFQRACNPNDYIVSADGDEIQLWKDMPHDYASQNVDMVLGRRVDRFNERLIPIDHTLELEANFPMEHDNLSKVLFPKRPRSRDKIIMARASIPVDYRKSIGLTSPLSNLKVTGEIPILHYKWRDNIFNRIRERSDYTPQEVKAIQTFFEAP